MRLIYAQGFSKNEKEEWRCIIFNNILSAFRQVMEAMDEMGIEFDSDFNTVRTSGSGIVGNAAVREPLENCKNCDG